jgi:hypothetical protein
MKHKTILKAACFMTVLAISLLTAAQAMADAGLPKDIVRNGVCIVSDPYDDDSGTWGSTFYTVLKYANKSISDPKSACQGGINLKSDIYLDSPKIIEIPSAPSNDYFEIKGLGSKRIFIDAGGITPPPKFGSWTDEAKQTICALTIRAHNIKLTNIEVRNSPAQGICIESSDNKLDNVAVTYSGYNAIKLSENARRNTISPNSMIKEVIDPNAYGIYMASIDPYAYNLIEGTSFTLAKDLYTSDDGLAIFQNKSRTVPTGFEITGLGANAIYSSADSRVVLATMKQNVDGTGKIIDSYTIEGGVTKKSYIPEQACKFESFLPEVTKIHLYGIIKTKSGIKTKFLTYVTDISKCANGAPIYDGAGNAIASTPCTYGLITNGLTAGKFNFRFDPTIYGIDGVEQIILIPELKGKSLGAPRVVSLIDLTVKGQDALECPYWGTANLLAFEASGTQGSSSEEPILPSESGAAGGSGEAGMDNSKAASAGDNSNQQGSNPSNTYNFPQFQSIEQCKIKGGAGPTDSWRDSDKDGISDYKEYGTFKDSTDPDIKCNCHDGELCWYLPDSDFDGIPDGSEPKRAKTVDDPNTPLLDETKDDPAASFDDTREHSCGFMGMNDCDGDGRKDGEEDRSRIFNPDRNAYLYLFNYLGGQVPYKPFGNLVPCTLEVGGERELGVNYKWYKLLSNGDHPSYNFETIKSNETIALLTCRNASVGYQTNFNGKCDAGRGESDMLVNGDGMTDKCAGDSSTAGNLDCIEGEIIQAIDLDYLELEESTGMPLKLADEDKNGIPDLFELDWKLIASKCSDLDHDSIPDCIERWDGKCGGKPGQQIGFLLDPYSADTDGDGFADGPQGVYIKKLADGTETSISMPADVCPATKGGAEGKADVSGLNDGQIIDQLNWSCSARNSVYNTSPNGVLACFLDRDNDGLRDCEEDVNKDGVASVDGKESDPLNPDEDNDGLGDYIERKYGTHPYKTDTDKDDLSDCAEICGDEANCPDPTAKNIAEDGTILAKKVIISECVLDVRTDAVKGCFEVSGGGVDGQCDVIKNPAEAKLDDEDEVGLSESEQFKNVQGKMRCYGDTDPLDNDTDGDDINDGLEVKVVGTNPLNKDSDGDDLRDDSEDTNSNGMWPIFENGKVKTVEKGGEGILEDFKDTNPCDTDTDEDGFQDSDESEAFPCAANPERSCKGNENSQGMDSDNDGLADIYEDDFMTTVGDADSDNDHVKDGDELWWHVTNNDWSSKTFLPQEGESDPALCILETEDDQITYSAASVGGITIYYLSSLVGTEATGTTSFCKVQIAKACGTDSDGDGMPDNAEYKYGTNPGVVDTDGDGIIDGVEAGWLLAEIIDPKAQTYRLRQNTGQYTYTPGSNFTNALDTDTDKDGLTDGFTASTNFEDKNCNGRPDTDNLGRPIELDPRNANSDGDKWTDKEEFCWNGICGAQAAIGRALSGQREGCANIGGAGGETWGMTLMFVMMLAATRVAVVMMRKTKKAKARR